MSWSKLSKKFKRHKLFHLPKHPSSSLLSVQSSVPSQCQSNGMHGDVGLQSLWSMWHVPDVHWNASFGHWTIQSNQKKVKGYMLRLILRQDNTTTYWLEIQWERQIGLYHYKAVFEGCSLPWQYRVQSCYCCWTFVLDHAKQMIMQHIQDICNRMAWLWIWEI